MLIDVAAATHIGRKKDKNEDSYGVFGEDTQGLQLFRSGALLVVADGLGGHIGGDIASKLAVSMVRDVLKEPPVAEKDHDSEREDDYYLSVLRNAIQRANASIHQANADMGHGKRPMGTTVCGALLRPKFVYLGNVGDSRGYLCRKGGFIARTEDHSWLDEQVKQGLMTESEARKDKRRNLLTRSVGTHPEIEVDTYQWRVEPEDQLLLCSDGLINMVPDADILEIINRPATTQDKVDALVELANANGGKDNITVVLARIHPDRRSLRRLQRQAWLRRHRQRIRNVALISLWSLLCLGAGYVFRWIQSG